MPKIKTIPLLEAIFKNKGGTSDLWKATIELLYKEEEISVFCPYIKNKINSYDKQTIILGLNFLDYCVDYGKPILWSAIGSNEFLGSLVKSLQTREDPEIQNRILYLIQKWGKKFKQNKSAELSNFENVYNLLKKNNITFPTNIESEYYKYVKLGKSNDFNNYNSKKVEKLNSSNKISYKKVETDPDNYLKDTNLDLNTSSYEKKYKRLVNKLYDWTHAIHEVNVLINKNTGGVNNLKISGLCKDLSYGYRQLAETIQSGRIKNNKLMDISLCVADDINMTLGRWSNYQIRGNPGPFVSSFFQNEEWRKKMNKENNKKVEDNKNNQNNNQNDINDFFDFKNNNNNSQNTNNYNIPNNINFNTQNNNKFDFFQNNSYNNNNNDFTLFNNNANNNILNYNNINNMNQMNNNLNLNINNSNNDNNGSFNLLIDFDYEPAPPTNNNNENKLNLSLKDKNNMDKFVDFITRTENQNKISQNKTNQNNIFNSSNNNSNQNPNNKFNNSKEKDQSIPNIHTFHDDNNINESKANKSLAYPSFEELEQNNTSNIPNPEQNNVPDDILDKYDF